jgi:hypothetical protein
MEAAVTVQDTRPFIALLADERGQQAWFDDMLEMQNLAGHIHLSVVGDQAIIEDAMLSGPEIGVHARGRADAAGREAMLLLRWHNLSAALELAGDRRHVDAIDARARFDAYRPGSTPLPSLVAPSVAAPVVPKIPETAAGSAGALFEPSVAPAAGQDAPAHKSHQPPVPQRPAPNNPFLDPDL